MQLLFFVMYRVEYMGIVTVQLTGTGVKLLNRAIWICRMPYLVFADASKACGLGEIKSS
jgi:hypothetical protein